MSLKSRHELLASTAPRYRCASRKERQTILNEFVAATGYHRKSTITILNSLESDVRPARESQRRTRQRKYTTDVGDALVVVWEAVYRICSKRLVPYLPDIVAALECHGHLSLRPETRQKLLSISPATVDRLLYETRHGGKSGGITTTRPG